MGMTLHIHMKITSIICIIFSFYKTLLIHYLIYHKEFLNEIGFIIYKGIMQKCIFTLILKQVLNLKLSFN